VGHNPITTARFDFFPQRGDQVPAKSKGATRHMSRRNAYLSIMVMGAVITMVGGTGIFAVFTDRATQGPNTADSGPRPSAADIQIAMATSTGNGIECGTFQEDVTTAEFQESNMQPFSYDYRYMCVKNVGAAPVTLTLSVIDLASSDPQCTGDESTVDDHCGEGAGHGQLADILFAEFYNYDCDGTFHLSTGESVTAATSNPLQVTAAPLDPGQTRCTQIGVSYPNGDVTLVQQAQSDSISWKFAFDAIAQ